jgi:benzoyl-CoA reductase subunit D
MLTAGIDMGAKTIKVVILKDGNILARSLVMSGREKEKLAEQALEEALKEAGVARKNIESVVSTGIGRRRVPFATDSITMPSANAKAVITLIPSARTILDVGAEEGRAIKCDEKGKIMDFATNEKCAAGAGTFVEVTARTLEVKLEDMGELSLKSTQKVDMNAQCAVFAESELVSLIHTKLPKVDIIHAVHDAVAGRIESLARTIEVQKDVVLVGGVALNAGFVDCLKKRLEVDIKVPEDPVYIGALGAAMLAASGISEADKEVVAKVIAKEQ